MKKIIQILLIAFFIFSMINCPTEKKPTNPLLFAALLPRAATTSVSDTSLSIRFIENPDNRANTPGSTIRVTGTGFSTTLANNTVTVAGTTATLLSSVLLSSGNTELAFTMPEIASISENQNVELVLATGGKSVTNSTLKYFPSPVVSPNVTNTISRTHAGTSALNSHWYRFTPTGNVNLINVSGYTGRDMDLYIYSSATSNTFIASVANTTTNSELLRTTILTAGTTYYLEIRLFSGTGTTYNLGIASQAVTGGASCHNHAVNSRCIDYMFNTTASQTDCGAATYTVNTTCATLALGTIVGRCTAATTGTNLGTVNYYSNGGSVFNAGTASAACTAAFLNPLPIFQ